MTLSCIVSTLAVLWLIMEKSNASLAEALKLLGWWPVHVSDVAQTLILTAILFVGPLFERGLAEGEWRDWIRGSKLSETLRGWIGWRNYVAVSRHGPFDRVAWLMACRARSLRKSSFDLPLSLCICWQGSPRVTLS